MLACMDVSLKKCMHWCPRYHVHSLLHLG